MNKPIKKIIAREGLILIIFLLLTLFLKVAFVGNWTLSEIKSYYDKTTLTTDIAGDGSGRVVHVRTGGNPIVILILLVAFTVNYPLLVYAGYLFIRFTLWAIRTVREK
ncbi:MAG: hypothetical protein ACYSSI_10335 [Planctomycetota bacterium]|jgi:hypothetical protein